MNQDLQLPYVALVPFKVLCDKNISDASKIHFGILSGLARSYGYCWATDEQLAQMHGVSIKNIERWNKELSDAGHIIRDTENICTKKDGGGHLWVRKRKIYTNEGFSNKVSGSPKNGGTDEAPKNEESSGSLKNEGYNIEPLTETPKQQQKDVVVVPSCLNQLNLTHEIKKEISKEYTSQEIELGVERTLKSKSRESDVKFLRWILREPQAWQEPLPSVPKVQKGNDNKELAQKVEIELQKRFGYSKMQDQGDYFCLDVHNGSRDENKLSFRSNGFREQLDNALHKKINLSLKGLGL